MPQRPQYWRLPGVTGATHAEREGRYEIAARFCRRRLASWVTELQSLFPAFGSAAVFAPALRGWGQSGDVTDYDDATLSVSLSEPPAWTEGDAHYISFLEDDGSLATPIAVTPGPDVCSVLLASAPTNAPVVEHGLRERTRYVFGRSASTAASCGAAGPGRDPGPGGQRRRGGRRGRRRHALRRQHRQPHAAVPAELRRPGRDRLVYTLRNDGGASQSIAGSSADLPNEWLYQQPQETTVTALFEVRATLDGGNTPTGLGSTLGCRSTPRAPGRSSTAAAATPRRSCSSRSAASPRWWCRTRP